MSRRLRAKSPRIELEELLGSAIWFADLSDAARDQVRHHILERTLNARESIGFCGETQRWWFGVLEGLLKWSINGADGRTVTLGGQCVGSWFGEGTLLRGRPRQADLVAIRDSRVAMLPFEIFDWLRRTEPSFNEFLLQQINERLHWFMGSYAAYRLLDTDRLVARALVGLVHPSLNPGGERNLQLSQEELANLATVSRQRCNEALVAMQRSGLVEIDYGGVRILQLSALQDLTL